MPLDSDLFDWYMPTFALDLPDGPSPASTDPDCYGPGEIQTANTDYSEFCSSAAATLSLLKKNNDQCSLGARVQQVIDAINGEAFKCFTGMDAQWRTWPANRTASAEALQQAAVNVDAANAYAQTLAATVQATRGQQSDQCVRLVWKCSQLAGYMAQNVFVQSTRGLALMAQASVRPAEAMGAVWDGISAMLTKTCERFAEQVPPLATQ